MCAFCGHYVCVQALVSNNVSLSIKRAVALSASLQPIPVSEAQQATIVEYISGRLGQLLADAGVQPEIGGYMATRHTHTHTHTHTHACMMFRLFPAWIGTHSRPDTHTNTQAHAMSADIVCMSLACPCVSFTRSACCVVRAW